MKKFLSVGLCLCLCLLLFFALGGGGKKTLAGGGGSVVYVDADITQDVTWSGSNVYYICSTKDKQAPRVTNGATLTIKNGATVYLSSESLEKLHGTGDKFPSSDLRVTNGSIVANGVIFTAVPGREESGWEKIEAMGSPEGDTSISFTDCTFKYGGNTQDGLLYGRGYPNDHSADYEVKISVSGCTFSDPVCYGPNYSPVAICYCNARKTETGTVSALNSTFTGFGTAVFVYHKQAEEEIETTVKGCTFSDISVRPLLIEGGRKVSVTDCVFKDFVPGQHGGPVFIYANSDLHHQNQMVTLTGNSFNYGADANVYPILIGARAQINEGLTGSAGNTFGAGYPEAFRYVALSGSTGYSPHGIYREAVWGQADIPYLLTEEMVVVGSDENNQSSLTIKPGVTVCLGPGTGSYVGNLYVRGTLTAVGTAAQPITFTKKKGLEYGNEISVTHYLRGSITLKHCIMDGLYRGIGIISPPTVEGPKILLENCTVRNCQHSMHLAGRNVTLKDCTLIGNGLNTEGGDAVNSITIEGCTITGGPGSGAGVHLRPVRSVVLKNCLITGFSHSGVNVIKNPYNMSEGAPLIENCTISGNKCGVVIDGISSFNDYYGPVIRNCIIAGNTDLDLANRADTIGYSNYYATLEEGSIAYSLIGDDGAALPFSQSFYEHSDLGMLREIAADAYSHRVVGDPLFADSYHLKSAGGRWNGSTWVADAVTSPCIDAGDPASAYAREPAPNGGRINLGCYGNTPLASKTPGGDTPPLITYTITASAGSNGAISPKGAVAVKEGGSRQFTITPKAGYAIADVKVDGSSVGAVSRYTFSNVKANHTITASFRPVATGVPSPDPYVPGKAITDSVEEVAVDLTRGSTLLSKKQMEALIALNREKPVVLYGEGYTITFPGGAMEQTGGAREYDFGIRFNEGAHYRTIRSLAGNGFVLMIHFNHEGALPGEAEICIDVGAKYAGKKLHYFYFNPKTGRLEYMQEATVDEKGWVTVKQSRCSSYLLTRDKKTAEEALPQTGGAGFELTWRLALALFAAAVIAFALRKSRWLHLRQ